MTVKISGERERIAECIQILSDAMSAARSSGIRTPEAQVRMVWIRFSERTVRNQDVDALTHFLRQLGRIESIVIETNYNTTIHRSSEVSTTKRIGQAVSEYGPKLYGLSWCTSIADVLRCFPRQFQRLQRLSLLVNPEYSKQNLSQEPIELSCLLTLRLIFPRTSAGYAFRQTRCLTIPMLDELVLEGDVEMDALPDFLRQYGQTISMLELSYGKTIIANEGTLAAAQTINPVLCPNLRTLILPSHLAIESVPKPLPNVTKLGLRSDAEDLAILPNIGESTLQTIGALGGVVEAGCFPSLSVVKLLHEKFPDLHKSQGVYHPLEDFDCLSQERSITFIDADGNTLEEKSSLN